MANSSRLAGTKGGSSGSQTESQAQLPFWEAETLQTESCLSHADDADGLQELLWQVQQVRLMRSCACRVCRVFSSRVATQGGCLQCNDARARKQLSTRVQAADAQLTALPPEVCQHSLRSPADEGSALASCLHHPPCCKVLLLTATVGNERKLTIMEANPRSMTEAGAARTKENLPSPPRSGLLPPPSRLGVQGRTMCRRAPDPLPHARLRVLSCCRRADKHAVPCCARPCWLLPRCHSGAERVGFWLAGAGEGGMVAIQFKYLRRNGGHSIQVPK